MFLASQQLSPTQIQIFSEEQAVKGFWDGVASAGPNGESPSEPLTIGFPAERVSVNIASGASIPITLHVPADVPIQQNNNDPGVIPVEYAGCTIREYTNFLCKKCNLSVSGYLVQSRPWVDDNKCPCGGK